MKLYSTDSYSADDSLQKLECYSTLVHLLVDHDEKALKIAAKSARLDLVIDMVII